MTAIRSTSLRFLVLLLALAGPASARAQSPMSPARGEAAAPVVILLFSDFQCPFCARVEPVLEQVRRQFPREVQVVFKHNPLPIHAQAPLAHEAAIEAGRQGKFWEMHDLLFASQNKLDRDSLLAYAAQLGLDAAAFRRALAERTHQPAVDRDRAEARALGLNSTPTLFVNGRRVVGVPDAASLTASIRQLMSGAPANGAMPVPPGAFDLTGSPSRGPADAPVTLVEFSDFQCGFCARATSTIARVVEQYPGKVRWILKHFPLDFHRDAPLAHRAALAAHEQGKFWEMHDTIFANQRALTRADFLKHAAALGLDLERFTRDMDGERSKAMLDRDLAEGSKVGIGGTPTTFVNGEPVVGAVPYETLAAAVERALAPAPGSPEGLELAMSRGLVEAPVTIRWFADLTSGLHREGLALMRRVADIHGQNVRILFRHLPSPARDYAALLHEAAVASAEQGRFWEFHDVLSNRASGQDREALTTMATRFGLNAQQFGATLDSGRARELLERHRVEAQKDDVRGTPTFFVNARRIDGVVDADELLAVVDAELRARPGTGAAPKPAPPVQK